MNAAERRRHRRYPAADLLRQAATSRILPDWFAGADLRVVNFSYGGICLCTPERLPLEASLPLWVITPLGVASVRARIKWVRQLLGGQFVAGAEYLESDKGWFGPEQDAVSVVERDGGALVGALGEDCVNLN